MSKRRLKFACPVEWNCPAPGDGDLPWLKVTAIPLWTTAAFDVGERVISVCRPYRCGKHCDPVITSESVRALDALMSCLDARSFLAAHAVVVKSSPIKAVARAHTWRHRASAIGVWWLQRARALRRSAWNSLLRCRTSS